jgi:hypothetical protein
VGEEEGRVAEKIGCLLGERGKELWLISVEARLKGRNEGMRIRQGSYFGRGALLFLLEMELNERQDGRSTNRATTLEHARPRAGAVARKFCGWPIDTGGTHRQLQA